MATKKTVKTAAAKTAEVKAADAEKTEAKTKTTETKTVETKAAEEKPAAAKKTEKKPAKAEKKPAAKRASKAAKKPAEKKEMKVNAYVEYREKKVEEKTMIADVKKAWTKSGGKVGEIKTMDLYIKPEENAVYYVINGTETGSVAF